MVHCPFSGWEESLLVIRNRVPRPWFDYEWWLAISFQRKLGCWPLKMERKPHGLNHPFVSSQNIFKFCSPSELVEGLEHAVIAWTRAMVSANRKRTSRISPCFINSVHVHMCETVFAAASLASCFNYNPYDNACHPLPCSSTGTKFLKK